jgi:hypothetical protein
VAVQSRRPAWPLGLRVAMIVIVPLVVAWATAMHRLESAATAIA